ncbi:MAG: response regulator [Proteobacteria bacterium]|nr:MAG: response regulator [Pseudomonadota bacterium]
MIIYIDDDADDQLLFEEIVESYGKEMKVYGKSQEFVSQLDTAPPDGTIVFLDLNMPFKTGEEVLEIMKASPLWSKVPVVILSTSISELTITNCMRKGANLYIVKARDYSKLRTSIDYALNIDFDSFVPDERSFVYYEIV